MVYINFCEFGRAQSSGIFSFAGGVGAFRVRDRELPIMYSPAAIDMAPATSPGTLIKMSSG